MDIVIASSLVGVFILGILSVFQLALIGGAPIGKFAWGGSHKVLPKKLRISSAFSIVLYAVFGLFILSKANLISIFANEPIVNVGTWIITAYFILGIVLNGISRSKQERAVMTPVAIVLALTFFMVAMS